MEQETRESFQEYVRTRSDALGRVAYLLTGDLHGAEDLVQQTLINVASRWENLRGDPEPYVRRALYHQHISWWRRHRREAVPLAELPDVAARETDPSLAVVVRDALARLAPGQRAVLVLRYFEDLTEAEAAAVLGVSVGTVKSQTRDALARLRAIAPDLLEVSR